MNVENEKCVIVVDENIPLGIIANTAAILGITMGMKMTDIIGNNVLDLECNPPHGNYTISRTDIKEKYGDTEKASNETVWAAICRTDGC